MSNEFLAHSANLKGETDAVRHHLEAVAKRAAESAACFGAENEARLAGLLHDVGKYGELFQRRLQGLEHGLDHWSLGAWIALVQAKSVAAALAIQGHHIGLQSLARDALREMDPEKLRQGHPLGLRLTDPDDALLLRRYGDDGLPSPTLAKAPPLFLPSTPSAAAMLDVRMLYSTLVDADFIETEAHFHPERRQATAPSLRAAIALEALQRHLDGLKAKSAGAPSVLALREDLLGACLAAGQARPGLFTLTAPTGTGKTYAMLAFALRHAAAHNLRRIVVVLPYLSIIEQTVQAYRQALSADVLPVFEHHSMAKGSAQAADDGNGKAADPSRWLAPNWDAPLIVTTSVQLLESLFANRSSACRKLHHLAQSVILFDEVQTLPLSLAIPTLATLSRLAERFGASVVFSTATQPAFSRLDAEVQKLCVSGWQPREIVPPALDLFARARRTRVVWPDPGAPARPWKELASELSACGQALCVLNLKRHALRLYDELHALGADGLLHLSTNLCAAHRKRVLEELRGRLKEGRPCLLVATQCVEAGVDLDFPVVYRAWGPLDAIAQAAGRCNRNGRRKEAQVFVFTPEKEGFPDGGYKRAVGVARSLGLLMGWDKLDLNDPSVFDRYYQLLYDISRPAEQNVKLGAALRCGDFVAVAEEYKLINQDAINVLVPYESGHYKKLRDDIFCQFLTRQWIEQAQAFSVSLYRPQAGHPAWSYLKPAPVAPNKVSEEWFVWLDEKGYDPVKGLMVPEDEQVLIG